MVEASTEACASDRTATEQRDRAAAFHTAMAHLYRGEMHRMTVWRQRLDVTTNWAILLTMGITTFTLGSPPTPHYVLLLGLAAIAIFIQIEARRYRHLHQSQWRLHVIERGYYRILLRENAPPCSQEWRRMLAEDIEKGTFRISLFKAALVRLRRNYLLLVYFTTAVWLAKLFIHPGSPQSTREFHQRFAVGDLFPPWFVVATAMVFILSATVLAFSAPSAEEVESFETTTCVPPDELGPLRQTGESGAPVPPA